MRKPLNHLGHQGRTQSQKGLSLVEVLIYMGLLGFLMLVVHSSLDYFQKESSKIQGESELSMEAQVINAYLRSKLTGGNTIQVAPGYTSITNGNHCYQISSNRPEAFDAVQLTNGAAFELRATAAVGSTPPAQDLLQANGVLGLSNTTSAASIRRSLSMWVKLPDSDSNNRTLFDYAPETGTSGFKLVVSVVNGNTLRVDVGMGLNPFEYSAPNIRDGDWRHIVVLTGDLTVQGAAPMVYIDGNFQTGTARSGTYSPPPQAATAYRINIGKRGELTTGRWLLGPTGLWGGDRNLTTTEIAQLGRMEVINTDQAFWMPNPAPNWSTEPTDVTAFNSINARDHESYILFKKVGGANGLDQFRVYRADTAQGCPDPGRDQDPQVNGFEALSTYSCAVATGSAPLLVGTGTTGEAFGFQWRCNLTKNDQVAERSLVSGTVSSAIKKSPDACGLPIAASDFATTSSAHTAYVIVDNFDPNLDLIAFRPATGPNVFPTRMTGTTNANGESLGSPPSVEDGTVSVTWFSDAQSNVGMMRVVTSPLVNRDKDWWVRNVFRKIVYKSRTNVYEADRKIVFALGDLWPIKTCPGLGYKSTYHFYKMESVPGPNTDPRMLRAYRDAYRNRSYHGMTGYLGNLRCDSEKEQVNKQVLEPIGANVYGLHAVWATTQGNAEAISTPNLANPNGTNSREYIDTFGQKQNDTFPVNFFDGSLASHTAGANGNTQWRLFGGPLVDHDVIILTDHTKCGRHSTNAWRGCQGMRSITVGNTTNVALSSRISGQSGGTRQYGWWHPDEPNKSGAFIDMGYDSGVVGANYWDDIEPQSALTNDAALGLYLLEFGDHPWDAVTAPTSAYKTAHASATDRSTNLDPPNVATKIVQTVKAQYCE